MPVRQVKHAPKHRSAPPEPALKNALRRSVTYSGVTVAVTGLVVTGGVAVQDRAPADTASAYTASAYTASGDTASATIAAAQAERLGDRMSADLRDRQRETSRSERRASREKEQRARSEKSDGRANRVEALADQDPRDIARRLMGEYGMSGSEFGCLDQLWISESDWDPTADNPTSTAYGIPQALTGGTHDNLPADYTTNPVSQIRWGLWYIENSYGTACSAWEFKQANDWY